MARPRGAKDKRPRRRRGTAGEVLKAGNQFKNLELGSRSIANLGRGLNSITNAVEQTRITAKYLGYVPSKIARQQALRNNIDLVNSGARAGNNVMRLRSNILGVRKVQEGMRKTRESSQRLGGVAARLGRLFL